MEFRLDGETLKLKFAVTISIFATFSQASIAANLRQ
jgi:hypothetical protein